MKIKTKIEIIIISFVCAVAVISGLLFLATQRAEKESVEAAKADELANEMSVFNALVFEYALHHEERPKMQARLKLNSIATLLKKEEFEYPEEQAVLEKIRKNYEHVSADFSMLIDVRESPDFSKKESVLSLGLEERLESSILFKSQEMIFDAFQLASMIREGEERYHDRVNLLIFISLAIIFAGMSAIAVLLTRSVTGPITRLHKGTEIIGSGKLDYKVGTDVKDELGQLSRAFDSMTDNLSKVMASRDELNREIEERKRTETELQHVLKSLEDINHELSILYQVSSVLSHTIDIKELFDIVLNTVTGLKDLNVERKGGIFLVEDGAMRLISHLGHSEEFLNLHRDMKVGECLCGQAVLTGEVIISKNSNTDCCHTIRYTGMTPHGHIILPLKDKEKVLGVLYLYLPADIDIAEDTINLLRYISNHIGMALDNARLYEETKVLSLHDPLTGLANRRLMDIIFERIIAAAKRHDIPFSALMIDIDHFKKYNDSFGHPAGDKLLRDISAVISDEIRGVDFAVRYGGEEFLVLLSEMDSAKAFDVAERLRKTVQEKTGVTVSLGISTYDGIAGKETLIQRADEALYRAKQNGRNRVEAAARHNA
ncbi:MAG: diguanylate cyclase [Thermodesulfovibrionia bacterium]|nr:diguanylate cyclase [Thermodesulfovibrionia bacterium]